MKHSELRRQPRHVNPRIQDGMLNYLFSVVYNNRGLIQVICFSQDMI